MSARPFRVWFWHNHVKRHWCNLWFWLRYRGEWKRRGLPMPPRVGAISQEAWDWAAAVAEEIERSAAKPDRGLDEFRREMESGR